MIFRTFYAYPAGDSANGGIGTRGNRDDLDEIRVAARDDSRRARAQSFGVLSRDKPDITPCA